MIILAGMPGTYLNVLALGLLFFIVICECKFDANNPDSACGERCLNVLTSTECTPEYCPCGINCKNQRFQKCEYAKTKLFRTEGHGWGLRADENIKGKTVFTSFRTTRYQMFILFTTSNNPDVWIPAYNSKSYYACVGEGTHLSGPFKRFDRHQ